MNTKQLLFSTFILSVSNITLGMERNIQYQTAEEMAFEHNMTRLSTPIADFINDFKTWPKEEQNKITTFYHKHGKGYYVTNRPAAADKYNGNIGVYLDRQLDQPEIGPFLAAIDYLKNKNQ